MRLNCVWVLAASCALLLAGCSNDNNGSGTGASVKKHRIAVIPKGTTHEFWKSVHAGAEKAAREIGNVEILWKGPHLEDDSDGQISVVQDFVTKRVSGICLAPLDSQGLIPYVAEAVQEKIPVVIFDSALNDETNIVSYVATDNYHGGELAAKQLADALGGKGNVILLRYKSGSESTEQREEGFLNTLKKDYPEITILSDTEYAGTTPEQALDKAQQMLIKYRDQVHGIFAVCEPNCTGVLKALEQERLAGKVKFVGFDPSPELISAMGEKKIHGIVLQDPVKMGYLAVMTMMHHINGQPVEKHISTGEAIATPENMSEPAMKKLLSPERFGE